MSFLTASLLALSTSFSFTSSLPSYPHHHPSPTLWSRTTTLLAFGDSYTYIQGTAGRQNFSFIGDVQHFAFTPHGLLSDLIVQNQTATAEGGPNWVEFLTDCGVEPGLTDPRGCKRALWDFAFAGADVSVEFLPRHHNWTVSFVEQVEQYIRFADPVLDLGREETLVVAWIGINDIGDSAELDVDFPSFYDELVSTQFAALAKVRALGFERFLVMELPPLDRRPGNWDRVGGPLPNATMVRWWNEAIGRHARAFEGEVMVFPTTRFLENVLDHADQYGIRNTTGYCAAYDQPFVDTDPGMYGCLPLEEYFWFNTGHMTSHTHKILSGEVEKFLDAQSWSIPGMPHEGNDYDNRV